MTSGAYTVNVLNCYHLSEKMSGSRHAVEYKYIYTFL